MAARALSSPAMAAPRPASGGRRAIAGARGLRREGAVLVASLHAYQGMALTESVYRAIQLLAPSQRPTYPRGHMTSDTRAQRLIDEFENAAYLDSASPLSTRHGIAAVLRHLADTHDSYSDGDTVLLRRSNPHPGRPSRRARCSNPPRTRPERRCQRC
jgi:hypothetical protein